jgi:hypothetical protein
VQCLDAPNSDDRDKCTTLTQPKIVEASKGDVFFKKPSMNETNEDTKRDISVVKLPTSRNKRPAPKPPETKTTVELVRETETTQQSFVDSDLATKVGLRSPKNIGHHLAGTTHIVPSSTHSDQEIHNTKPTVEVGEHPALRVDHTNTLSIRSEIHFTKPDAGTGPITSVHTASTKSTSVNEQGLTNGNTVPYMESTDTEDNVTCLSVLSDSGTTSNSSGYSSDVPDHLRLVGMNGSVMKNKPPLREEDEAERFEEDECVLYFEDEEEEETKVGRHTLIYKEYHGEDFAHYFQDDVDSGLEQTPEALPRRSRYVKNQEAQIHQTAPSSNGSTVDRYRKKGLKQKFTQMFTLSKQHKRVSSNPGRNGSIQNFSFADSKMGVILGLDPEQSDKSDKNMGSIMSDVGLRDPYWTTDTLAARSLKRRPDFNARRKRSSSMGDIIDNDFSDRSQNHVKQDFESYRKSQMFDTKSSYPGAKKENIWSKIGRTLRKKDKTKREKDNTTDNPIAGEHQENGTQDMPL